MHCMPVMSLPSINLGRMAGAVMLQTLSPQSCDSGRIITLSLQKQQKREREGEGSCNREKAGSEAESRREKAGPDAESRRDVERQRKDEGRGSQ